MGKTKSLFDAAKLIALVTIVSKFAGFLRDVVIAGAYGAGIVSDAYFYAYQIPALAIIILGGVGGPFHSAVVAVFAKMIPQNAEHADERLNKLYSSFLTGTIVIFGLLSLAVFVFAEPIIKFIISEGSPALISLSTTQLRIMSPIILVGGIIGVYYGILVTFREFLLPNLSPIIMSTVIIAGILIARNDPNGYVLAIATTLGAFAQFGVQFPKVRKLGFRLKPSFHFKNNPELRNLWELLFPAVLSSTVGQIYVYADMFFASGLQEGAWSAIGYANRIFQFPVGILMTAFLVPLFPLFSRLVGEKNYDDVRFYFNKGVGMLNLIAFPILIAIILLAHDGVYLLFQRGNFENDATVMVATALTFLGFGIIPYVFRDSVTRIYYAFNDSKTPFLVALFSITIKVLLNFILVKPFGIGGITLSTTLVTLVNAILLGVLLRKKIDLKYGFYLKNIGKQIIASCGTLAVCMLVYKFLPTDLNWIMTAVKTAFMMILCFGFYVVFAMFFRVEYIKETGLRLYETIVRKR